MRIGAVPQAERRVAAKDQRADFRAERRSKPEIDRRYKNPAEPAPPGAYDFITYFECADADVPTFHGVCAALRDVTKNPEWKFAREGPTWHGRRVATWAELFA